MEHQHEGHMTVTLSENDHGAICKCRGCNMYTLAYKTILIPFPKEKFYGFEKVLTRFRSDDFNLYHPQGMKAMIRNNVTELCIALTYLEVQELLNMYQEAKLMDEVFGVLG